MTCDSVPASSWQRIPLRWHDDAGTESQVKSLVDLQVMWTWPLSLGKVLHPLTYLRLVEHLLKHIHCVLDWVSLENVFQIYNLSACIASVHAAIFLRHSHTPKTICKEHLKLPWYWLQNELITSIVHTNSHQIILIPWKVVWKSHFETCAKWNGSSCCRKLRIMNPAPPNASDCLKTWARNKWLKMRIATAP
jgi:hypothetical protein